ncbi:hypothetical protein U9R90_21880 [Streptomyces sp. E11-3]|uniref:hypothetical protein n=1 Tax=Streptomyces sp. E11-3 TaxID=3110112 RepID=UPI00397F8D03
MRISRRMGAWLAATGLMATGALAAGAGTAAAAPKFTFKVIDDGKSFGIAVYNNGRIAGSAYWQADPIGSAPGDTLYATDNLSDGYGITGEVWTPYLSSTNYRKVSTWGHKAPYKTPNNTKNLREGTSIMLQVCIGKGSKWGDCGSWGGYA